MTNEPKSPKSAPKDKVQGEGDYDAARRYDKGAEKFVATYSDANGAGPGGVDVDAAGNIYVANNNAGFTSSGTQSVSASGSSFAGGGVYRHALAVHRHI